MPVFVEPTIETYNIDVERIEEKVTDKNSTFYKELLAFLSARKQSSYLDNGFIRAALTPFFEFAVQYFSSEEKRLFPDELSEEAVKQLHEGTVKKINVNVYERNPEARRICIKKYGCKCQVCGMDFQKTYGELGKGFIHVHHIIPLHSIKSDYIINGETDLIPVCPNCHAMLHKSVDGEFMTVEELRKIVQKANNEN